MTRLNDALPKLMKQQIRTDTPNMSDGLDRLSDFDFAGTNPGALKARCYVPEGFSPGAPLVVVLHGCTQTASAYDRGTGWSQLADEHGFAVLFPEQQRANNPNSCFNWFSPVDQRRDSGEALSIRQMIAAMANAHAIDAERIFITGLSAGGAMASIMLATYPEVFAGGAIIAGLAYGSARSVGDALARMQGDGFPTAAALGAAVTAASNHDGPWPRIAIWQGSADTVVDPANADHIVAQWQVVHGVTGQTPEQERLDIGSRRIWRDASGRAVIEAYAIDGMGHGAPLATGGIDGCGVSGPYMLEAGISSTRCIAVSWGLAVNAAPAARVRLAGTMTRATQRSPVRPAAIATLIEDRLRAAGLMR